MHRAPGRHLAQSTHTYCVWCTVRCAQRVTWPACAPSAPSHTYAPAYHAPRRGSHAHYECHAYGAAGGVQGLRGAGAKGNSRRPSMETTKTKAGAGRSGCHRRCVQCMHSTGSAAQFTYILCETHVHVTGGPAWQQPPWGWPWPAETAGRRRSRRCSCVHRRTGACHRRRRSSGTRSP